ncbi:OLC1v1006234C1 [Oldenlandia corymbosa var. corymbosa]|uniref:OLC1v1006234C1 n=1 Tax=Oldenlandia corymbosa var. corymbosa TaxID=529605 RepID=A0AAV1DGH9_OLDCO|nr:OLC1v1006234C1 [Oldenlandia corymbosa var. corymbosa]
MFNLQDSLENFGGDGEDYSILFATDEEFAEKDDVVAYVKSMGMANGILINVVSSKKKNAIMMRCCKGGKKTWLVVDYKFVKAWTNVVFHMGNTTTGRVESAHKQLKTWLETSTASLDTLWAKVHLEIQSQLTEIRYKLEYSRQKIGTHYCGFPLNRLKCQVSHTCLQKLNTEWSKAQEWKEETNDRCDHVVYWTCRIPCACALKKAADAGTSITLKHIHPLWATLNIGEQAGTSAPSNVDDEVLYTRQLMEELNECPKAVKRRKGRPKGAKSKKKAEANTLAHEQSPQKKATPNVWDYRDEAQGKSTTVTCDSSKKRPSSSGGHTDASTEIFASDISQYGCYDLIPWPIQPYITSYLDVGADGNCGFRVIASNMFLSQDKWAMAREAMANELEQNWHLYTRIYGTSCQEEVRRIRWSGQGFAPECHWMCATDLFVVATIEATCPAFEIGVCHHGIYKHFIRINLDGDFPVPPINNRWSKEHQPSVAGWELPLLPRIQDWYRLVPSNPGRPVGDYANDFIDFSFLY